MEQTTASPRLTDAPVRKLSKGMNQHMKRLTGAARAALLVCFVVAGVVGTSSVNVAAKGANWAQFRRPEGSGVSRETGVPTEWDATQNVVWKTPMQGHGNSSPAVADEKIFIRGEQNLYAIGNARS